MLLVIYQHPYRYIPPSHLYFRCAISTSNPRPSSNVPISDGPALDAYSNEGRNAIVASVPVVASPRCARRPMIKAVGEAVTNQSQDSGSVGEKSISDKPAA